MDQKPIIYITGSLDFQAGKAYIAVPHKRLSDDKLKSEIFLITSEREKLYFSNKVLLEHQLYAEREPFLLPRWQWENIETFLQGEPAPDLESIYQSLVKVSENYFDFGDQRWHSLLALWIIGTYFHRLFSAYPYIHLNGNAGTGKTKCLSFIALLAFNGELSVNNTPSYMIRVIHNNHATTCIDEVEKLDRAKDEDSKTILAMLNAGYKKGSYVGKSEQTRGGKNWEPKRFEAYSPKVLAGIRNLEHTLTSRCIPLIMVKSSNQSVVNTEVNEEDDSWQEVRNNLYRVTLEHYTFVKQYYLNITDHDLLGRPWELWKPILALAQAINVHVYNQMKELAVETESHKKDMEGDISSAPRLMQALLELLNRDLLDEKFYTTEEIYVHLGEFDEEEYDWLKKPENKTKRGRWLGNELRRAGVVSGKAQQKKVEGKNTKGYSLNKAVIIERLKGFGITSNSEVIHEAEPVVTELSSEALPEIPF
jgi:hypothetical protein